MAKDLIEATNVQESPKLRKLFSAKLPKFRVDVVTGDGNALITYMEIEAKSASEAEKMVANSFVITAEKIKVV